MALPSSPPASLRAATPEDRQALLRIWREAMEQYSALDARFALADSAEQEFLAALETVQRRDDHHLCVADVGGQAVGFSVSSLHANSPVYRVRTIGVINDLAVAASRRGQGIGELLVQDAVRWLLEGGAESIQVYVAHESAAAQRFWRRMGGQDYLDRLSIELSRYVRG